MSSTRIEVLKKLEGFLRSEEGKVDPKPTESGVELVSIGNKQDANLPYLPYIGKDYFQQPFKVAFYAEAQNLNEDFVKKVAEFWEDCRVDGLGPGPIYRSYNYPFTEVGPWDGGFGRVICAMLLAEKRIPPSQIDDMVVVSNAFRFSYRYRKENYRKFPGKVRKWTKELLQKELDTLEPDIVIAFGRKAEGVIPNRAKSCIIYVPHSSSRARRWWNKWSERVRDQENPTAMWEKISAYFAAEHCLAQKREETREKQEREPNEVGEGATEKVNLQFIEKRWPYFAAALGAIREQLGALNEDKQCL